MSCACTVVNLGYNNGYRLRLTGLVDFNDVEQNSATVTFQIYDDSGTAVTNANGSFTADGTGGNYTGIITPTILDLLDEDQEYQVRVEVTASGTGYDAEFTIGILPGRRGQT